MSRPRVLLADDHTMVAQGIAALLGDEFELVGTVGDGLALLDAARRLRPDVVVSDVSMPGLSGLEALRRLRAETPEVRLVMLTMHADPNLAAEALRAGACGYLLKHAAGEELAAAIRQAVRGAVYLSPEIARDAIAAMARSPQASPLTPRQRDVLRLVAEGMTLKQIAAELGISPRTVETHKYDMMEALGVSTTAELIRYALEQEREGN